jgi:hypothetical protein
VQQDLRNILSEPPHGLGAIANILLLFSIILTGSIFFIQPTQKDITLNLEPIKASVEIMPAKKQLAKKGYDKLYAIVKVGQNVAKNDTLYRTITNEDIATIYRWKGLLQKSSLLPTAEMIDQPFVDQTIRRKMLDLAQVKSSSKNVVDTKRITQLKKESMELSSSIVDYQRAIEKFKKLDAQYKKDYARAKEAYQDQLISLSELKKVKQKENDNLSILAQRERELESEKLLLFNAKSELDYLNKSKNKISRIDKSSEYPFFEADLTIALDSLLQASAILAEYDGTIEALGEGIEISVGDVLAIYAEEKVLSNRSEKLIAKVNSKEADRVLLGSELIIYLQDGSKVSGKVVSSYDVAKEQFVIAADEELSDMDVDQIILPAKNQSFIEKVLDNF